MTRARAQGAFCSAAVLAAVCTFSVFATRTYAKPPANLQKFLREVIKFSDADFAAVEKGEIVTRLLAATDKGEIAAFGILRASSTADVFERLARDPMRYHAMEGIEQMGMLSDPAGSADVAKLVFPKQDIDALKKCRPGSCDVKLTDDALERIAKIDWSAKDANTRAEAACKQMIVDLATAYRGGGLKALGTMVDKKEPKSRAAEFHRLLKNSPYLYKYIPSFHAYIENYPAAKFKGATTQLYWMKDTFSPKPVISVCASSVARVQGSVLIGCRQLTATHFFNAGLDITWGVPAEGGPGLYIVDIYRVRIDPPTGMLAGPAMKRVENGISEGVGKSLAGIRARLKG